MRQVCFYNGARAVRFALIVVTLSVGYPAMSTAQQAAAPQCHASGPLVRMPDLPEASGVAVSRRSPGRLWAHNDSGDVLVALDTRGSVTGRVSVSGMKVDDWEAVAVGACPTARASTLRTLATTRPGASGSRFIVSLNPPTRTPWSSRIRFMRCTPTAHTTRRPCSLLQTAVCSS